MNAVDKKKPEIIKQLLNAGASTEAKDTFGRTSLLRVAVRTPNNPDLLSILLDAGANKNAQDNYGMTALMYVANKGDSPSALTVLLDAGADITIRSDKGKTAWFLLQLNYALKGSDEALRLQIAPE